MQIVYPSRWGAGLVSGRAAGLGTARSRPGVLLRRGGPGKHRRKRRAGTAILTSCMRIVTSRMARHRWDGGTRGPQAEPLLGAPGLEPFYLGEPQLRGQAQRAGVSRLGLEYHRLAGKLAGEPAECRCARLGGVPESPRLRQERVARARPARRWSVAVLISLADHGSIKSTKKRPGGRSGAPSISRSSSSRGQGHRGSCRLGRGPQLDERCPIPGLGLTEHQPLGLDRVGRPSTVPGQPCAAG